MIGLLVSAFLLLLASIVSRGRSAPSDAIRRGSKKAVRMMAARGAAVATISREMRLPHDVVVLAVHTVRPRGAGLRQNLPLPAVSAAEW